MAQVDGRQMSVAAYLARNLMHPVVANVIVPHDQRVKCPIFSQSVRDLASTPVADAVEPDVKHLEMFVRLQSSSQKRASSVVKCVVANVEHLEFGIHLEGLSDSLGPVGMDVVPLQVQLDKVYVLVQSMGDRLYASATNLVTREPDMRHSRVLVLEKARQYRRWM